MFLRMLTALLFVSCASIASATDLKTRDVEYKDGETVLQGKIVYEGSQPEPRPAVIVFHDWMGPTDVTVDAAQKIASMGYVAFIADIYGKGIRPQSVKEASEVSGNYKADRPLMRRRAAAAVAALSGVKEVDTAKIGTVGFCFGGTVGLELARSGGAVLGTVSFHGGLETPDTSLAKNIKGKILALHGADDPFVPDTEVLAFEQEMRAGKVDWELIKFGNAVHAFTNKKVDELKLPGAAYNKDADRRSFESTEAFFKELYK